MTSASKTSTRIGVVCFIACISALLCQFTARAESEPPTLQGEVEKLITGVTHTGTPKKNLVKLDVVGVDDKLREHMKHLIGGRLEYLLEPPATRAVADDLAFIFEMMFRDHGFPEVLVKWHLVNEAEIKLDVTPGEPAKIGDVTITGLDGSPIDPVKVKEILLAPSINSDDIEGDGVPYVLRTLEEGERNVHGWLKSQGYWHAEVKLNRPRNDKVGASVDLGLDIDTGPLVHVGTVNLVNLETGENALVQPAIDRISGKVATADLLIDFEQDIAKAFSQEGYYNTQTRFTQAIDGDTMDLSVSVLPGRLLHVGGFSFTGQNRTKRATLERRFAGLEGTLYSDERFREKLETLYRTGVFSRIDVQELVEPDDTMDYILTITEGTSKRIGVFAGIASETGTYSGIQYRDHNVLGRLHRFDMEIEYSSIGLRGELAYSIPWIFGDKTVLQSRLFAVSRDYAAYDKQEFGWEVLLALHATDHYKAALSVGGHHADITGLQINPALAGPTRYYVSQISLNQSYDRRNDPVSPREGWIASLHIDFAGEWIGSDINLIRGDTRFAYYVPIKDHSHIRIALAGGSIHEPDGALTTPIDERFFQGGASSIRSFRDRRGPPYSPNGKPIGGNSYKFTSAEYVGKLKGPLQFVVFCDAGNVTESTDPTNFDDTEVAVGGGIRIALPTGPIRLEYGHNMTHDEGETEGTLHFVIGMTF